MMDEPLSNWTAKLRVSMATHLCRTLAFFRGSGDGPSTFTHDQPEAMNLGHRVAVMRHGRIVQVGTPPSALYDHRAIS